MLSLVKVHYFNGNQILFNNKRELIAMSRSVSVSMVYEEGEIYFTPKNNEVIRFRSIKKEEFEKSTPK